MDRIDLDELERLRKAATPGPWDYDTAGVFKWHFLLEKRHVCECLTEENSAYIVAACNAVPELIAENRALRKRVRELEKAMIKLVKIEVPLPECAVCWERDKCTDRAHGDNCLAIGYIIDTAMEAAKEAGE